MNVSVVIATAGSSEWSDLAWSRAYPSTLAQNGGDRGRTVIEHYPDLSVAAARNAAAARTDAEWLCFLDADDLLEPGYLAAMSDAFSEQREWLPYDDGEAPEYSDPVNLYVPAVRRVFPDGHEEGPGIPNQGRWPTLNECVIGTLIQRDQFEKLGGFRDFPLYEDWDLWLRAYKDGARLVYVEDAVYRECVNPGGRNSAANAREIYDRIWADYAG